MRWHLRPLLAGVRRLAETAIRLIKRYEQLYSGQSLARTAWQDIADFVIPYKSNILTIRGEGARQTDKLFDATAPHALMLLGASLNASMTPATQPWLSLKMRQEELNAIKEVQDWLEDCARRMHRAFRQSTFNQNVHELYLDLAAFGLGALFVDERPPLANGLFGGFRFLVPAVGTYCIAENADGQVDTFFRTFSLSVRAMYGKWGPKIGQDLVQRLDQKPDEMIEVLHAVFPRADRAYGTDNQPKRGGKNMAFASCYVAMPTRTFIEEGGFEDFPFCVPRWAKTSGEVYGRGPSHTALPDVATLNAAKEFILKAAPLAMIPPTLERDDAVVGAALDLTPGGRNSVNGSGPIGDQLAFMDTRQRVDMSQMILSELRQGIHAIYFTDQLVLHEKPDMTATEVLALQEQMQRLLGPTTGRLESEFLNPLVQRAFAIMARSGAFLPLPQALQEVTARGEADLDIEYEGPMARAQRTIELAAQDRTVAFVLGLTQGKAQFPGSEWDLLKTDKMIRDRAEITGLPSDNLEDQQQVEQIRQARAQEADQQKKMAQAQQVSEMAKNITPMATAMSAQNGAQAGGQMGGAA